MSAKKTSGSGGDQASAIKGGNQEGEIRKRRKKQSVRNQHGPGESAPALDAKTQDQIRRWLSGTLTSDEKKELDERLTTDSAFGRQFIPFVLAEKRRTRVIARMERGAAIGAAPSPEHCACDVGAGDAMSDREMLFLKCLHGDASAEEVKVLSAEAKADPAFIEQAADLVIMDVELRELLAEGELEEEIKRGRSPEANPRKRR